MTTQRGLSSPMGASLVPTQTKFPAPNDLGRLRLAISIIDAVFTRKTVSERRQCKRLRSVFTGARDSGAVAKWRRPAVTATGLNPEICWPMKLKISGLTANRDSWLCAVGDQGIGSDIGGVINVFSPAISVVGIGSADLVVIFF